MITTKVHGYLDYLMGALLTVAPFLFNVPEGAATTLLIVLGIGTILYSLMTNYELGMWKMIPMKTHLGIDVFAGFLLIAAPWIFSFSEDGYWLFVILGLVEIGAALMTDRKTIYHSHPQV